MMPINLTKFKTSLSTASIGTFPAAPLHALYVHVPFCERKCAYCDFYSQPSAQPDLMQRYVRAVLRESELWTDFCQANSPFSTVFFGGGTPTALPPSLMQSLILGLRDRLPIAPNAEWTTEANPATIEETYCGLLLESGINRLSLGAQSLLDAELQTLGRIHNAQEVCDTVAAAIRSGFQRVSIDLMYAIPGQTIPTWKQSLDRALELGITHISCYCLTLEEDTPMWRRTRRGDLPETDEQTQIQFMRFTRDYLAMRGIHPYEISNYAVPGEECRHNIAYWRAENYLGLGPAAASHLAGHRWRNAPDTQLYCSSILDSEAVPAIDDETLSLESRADELVMLMLRMTTGLTWERLAEVAGNSPQTARIQRHVPRLLGLGLISQTSRGIQLTEKGVLVADEVIGELVRDAD